MAKKKKEEEPEIGRDYKITYADIVDEMCNYHTVITGKKKKGEKNKITGVGIVKEDLLDAISAFNVHLACIDDAFKYAGIEIADIDTMRGHELTGNYQVTGFRIKSGCVVLVGTKYVSMAGDHMALTSPKIPLDSTSSYKWYNELNLLVDTACEEVCLYKEGKYTEKEPIKEDDPNQINMFAGNEKTEL